MNLRRMVLVAAVLAACLTTWVVGVVVGQQGPAPFPQGSPSTPLPVYSSPPGTLPSRPDPIPPRLNTEGTFDLPPALPPGTLVSSPAAPQSAPSGLMPVGRPQPVPYQQPSGFQTAPAGAPPSLTPLPNTGAPGIAELPAADVQGASGEQEATQTNENPTGRQEPAVSIEWIGPPTAKLGQPVTYQIVVKNNGSCPAQQVIVRNRFPAGVTVQATEPRAVNEGNVWVWDLGMLPPRQEKRIDLQLVPETRGDLACQATITFTGVSTARLRVREPKLVVKAVAPEQVLLGDTATIMVTVTNPGDGVAEQVKVRAMLPEGLEHSRGRNVEFDLRNLGPNESRSVQLVCMTKTVGPQRCDIVAVAEGNLTAKDQATVNVILPQLDLAVAGPHLRYLDRHAVYVFKVTNPGSAPASNVSISDQIPSGFKFVNASAGGRLDFPTRMVSWFIGDLAPGQSQEVSLDVVAINTGEHKHQAIALAARGIKTEAQIITRVEGLPALLMELVDLDDPVEVGADTAYEIRITNTGSKTETNLQLICTVPEKMEVRGAVGAAGTRFRLQGRELIFEPLPKLAPRADAIFRVNVRGIAPGDLRFRARITADGLTDPVLKEESTKVYGDEGPSK